MSLKIILGYENLKISRNRPHLFYIHKLPFTATHCLEIYGTVLFVKQIIMYISSWIKNGYMTLINTAKSLN